MNSLKKLLPKLMFLFSIEALSLHIFWYGSRGFRLDWPTMTFKALKSDRRLCPFVTCPVVVLSCLRLCLVLYSAFVYAYFMFSFRLSLVFLAHLLLDLCNLFYLQLKHTHIDIANQTDSLTFIWTTNDGCFLTLRARLSAFKFCVREYE